MRAFESWILHQERDFHAHKSGPCWPIAAVAQRKMRPSRCLMRRIVSCFVAQCGQQHGHHVCRGLVDAYAAQLRQHVIAETVPPDLRRTSAVGGQLPAATRPYGSILGCGGSHTLSRAGQRTASWATHVDVQIKAARSGRQACSQRRISVRLQSTKATETVWWLTSVRSTKDRLSVELGGSTTENYTRTSTLRTSIPPPATAE